MKPKPFFLSVYGWTFWLPMLLTGTGLMATLATVALAAAADAHGQRLGAWTAFAIVGLFTLAGLAFFRDFHRTIPQAEGLMVAPADGTVTEITPLPHDEFLGAPALRIGIFLSVLSVHVNRVPCHGMVVGLKYQEGLFLDARHRDSGLKNQSSALVLGDPTTRRPIAVVKQIVGAIARRIITPVQLGELYARGERYGMIAFGSRTELYVPQNEGWEPAVQVGQYVYAGQTILLRQRTPAPA